MAEQCGGPGCVNTATTGPLCYVCERKWMHERGAVVEEASHLTKRWAEWAKWCSDHGQPNPFD
jgi:hypothetical protein